MIRRSRAVRCCGGLIVLLALATGAPRAQLRELPVDRPAVLSINLSAARDHYRPRVTSAAHAAIDQLRLSLGSPPERLAIDDSAPNALDLPWLSSPRTMEVEAGVAFAIARQWWPGWQGEPRTRPLADGLAWYLQSRVVPGLFDRAFHRPGYQAEAMRVFGGSVPWAFPILTLGPDTAGLGRSELLRDRDVGRWMRPGRRLPSDADPLTPRVAHTWATMERLVGWPALESALLALGDTASVRPMTPEEVAAVLSAATGYPLDWLVAAATDPASSFDYRLEGVVTGTCGEPSCVSTEITVANHGSVPFTPSAGGDGVGALELRVVFADGQEAVSRWNGRERSRVFRFESRAAPVSVELDPDGIATLDRSRLDNRWQASPTAAASTTAWIAWWLLWLQDASLSYGALL